VLAGYLHGLVPVVPLNVLVLVFLVALSLLVGDCVGYCSLNT
jgi:hypothetical protein